MSKDESESFGLACDGDCVVVDLRNYRFQSHCLLVMGVVTSILGVAMAFVGLIVWQWPALIIFIPLLVGATLVVAGVRLLIKVHRPLSIERFQDGFVWLGGVHPGMRDALPPWQDSVAAIALRSRMARRRLGPGGVVLIIGLLYAAFQYERHDAGDAGTSHFDISAS